MLKKNESGPKPNKIWAHKTSTICNRSMKSRLQGTDKEIYSRHNEGKSVVAERFIRTLKSRIYKWLQYWKMSILIK